MKNFLHGVCLSLIVTAGSFNPAMPQRLEQLVSLRYENQTLGMVLNNLERDFGLKFSYAQSDIPLERFVDLHLTNRPLKDLLDLLSGQVGLEYSMVDDHIALYSHGKEPENSKQSQRNKPGSQATFPATISFPEDSSKAKENIMTETFPHAINLAYLRGIPPIRQVNPERGLLFVLSYDSSQKKSDSPPVGAWKKWLYLGPVISAGFYSLSGNSKENEGFSYKTAINYGIGLSAKRKVKERWGILVQALYSTKNFDLYYNFETIDPDDPYVPDKTVYQQAYLDIPLLLNYQVLKKGNWKFFGEGGFIPGFLLNSKMETFHRKGTEMETPEFLAMKIRPQLFGAQLGIATEYRINKYVSLTLATGWRQYFNGINKEDLPTKLGLFQSAAGIRYTL